MVNEIRRVFDRGIKNPDLEAKKAFKENKKVDQVVIYAPNCVALYVRDKKRIRSANIEEIRAHIKSRKVKND